MSKKQQLVWFRSDLRATDNKALYHASQAGPVIGVFFLYPEQWQDHGDSSNKLWFMLESLKILKSDLQKLNISLLTIQLSMFKESASTLIHLAEQYQCEGIWFNNEYAFNELTRDGEVEQLFIDSGLKCNRFTDQLLFAPGTVLTGKGDFFKVFTPFKKVIYRKLQQKDITPLPAPSKQEVKLQIKENKAVENPYTVITTGIESFWPPGEQEAHNRLHHFIEQYADSYHINRDFPALSGTSTLSPWLTCGSLSIRQCFYAALLANNGEMDTGNEGLCCWLSELVWREFYRHILVGFPRVSRGRAFVENTEQLPWRNDKNHFEAWKQGKTGFPLVDAAMRQLVATGWMHNRLRMVSAMFLSKNLMLDWRLGERFFMEHLIDGDLAANNGGWQWAASTGTDAAPYFRMFNPFSQSKKFDKKGLFIKKWLPELAELDSVQIHEPYSGGDDMFNHALDYPYPIVDHAQSRARAIEAFKKLG